MRNFFPITALLKNIAEMIHVINYIQLVNDNLIELNQNKSDPTTTKFTDAYTDGLARQESAGKFSEEV